MSQPFGFFPDLILCNFSALQSGLRSLDCFGANQNIRFKKKANNKDFWRREHYALYSVVILALTQDNNALVLKPLSLQQF